MSKTFREVIRDIKPYESYRCDVRGANTIQIDCNKEGIIKINSMFQCLEIAPCYEFKKIKSKVPFDIAIEEYYKGKEIESVYSGNKYKSIDDIHHVKTSPNSEWKATTNMQINEIRNSWFIND